MKTICPLIALAGLLWSSLAVAGNPELFGPATVKFSCASQDLNYQPVSAKTNFVGSNTNVALVLKSTVTNFTMDTDSLLALFANSLNTNFPSGTKLLLRGAPGGFFSLAISDSTGTNVPSPLITGPVLNSKVQGFVSDGRRTQSTNQTSITGNDTESFTSAVRLQYADFSTTTTDHTHTYFTLNCRIESKQSQNLATGFAIENVTMTVTGGGTIRGGPAVIITGTIRGKIAGFP